MTNTELANVFLEKYRVLEDLLSARYSGTTKHHVSVVMNFAQSNEGARFAEQLDLCREIRNILSHNPEMSGFPVVTPAPDTIALLDEIIEYVKSPPQIITWATPLSAMLTTHMNDKLLNIMRAMYGRGFSHVPVMDSSRLTGVLSRETVFTYITLNGGTITEAMRVSSLKRYLPIDKHASERYVFMRNDDSVLNAAAEFNEKKKNGKRLSVIFLTPSGKMDDELCGMVTPWDLLGKVKAEAIV